MIFTTAITLVHYTQGILSTQRIHTKVQFKRTAFCISLVPSVKDHFFLGNVSVPSCFSRDGMASG